MTGAPLIIRGGQAIEPEEVERILLEHPAVAEAAVVGIPDRFWDEIVAVAVTLSVPPSPGSPPSPGPPPLGARELSAYCRRRLAPHKVPARWLLCPALPRTPAGEVCRRTLAAQLAVISGLDDGSRRYGSAGIAGLSWLAGVLGLDGIFGLDGTPWTRPARAVLRVPPQVRRSQALEDLDYL